MAKDQNKVKNVLVLCGGNSCRSQMAEGYLRHFAKDRANVYSAGNEAKGIHPLAVEVMQEDGIDISSQTSNKVDDYFDLQVDFLITVCDSMKEGCPWFPGTVKRFHHDFPDPALAKGSSEEIWAEFRKVRDAVKEFCKSFAEENL